MVKNRRACAIYSYQMVEPWLRLGFDSRFHYPASGRFAEYIARVKCPILALGGDKDIAIPAKKNHKALDELMAKMKRTDYQTVEFPGLNHFFQTCKIGTFVESAALEETMSPKVMQTIADWILREMIKKPSK